MLGLIVVAAALALGAKMAGGVLRLGLSMIIFIGSVVLFPPLLLVYVFIIIPLGLLFEVLDI